MNPPPRSAACASRFHHGRFASRAALRSGQTKDFVAATTGAASVEAPPASIAVHAVPGGRLHAIDIRLQHRPHRAVRRTDVFIGNPNCAEGIAVERRTGIANLQRHT